MSSVDSSETVASKVLLLAGDLEAAEVEIEGH